LTGNTVRSIIAVTLLLLLGGMVLIGLALVRERNRPEELIRGTGAGATPPGDSASISSSGRKINFSGYDWLVKTSLDPVGPGPNYFSDSSGNVWIDERGRLHLRISQDATGRWQAAEAVMQTSLGYGTYRFVLDSPVDNLDPNVVLGLFTWSDDPAQNHREVDIEFGRFGEPAALMGRYTVQPYTAPGQYFPFEQPSSPQSTHSFVWTSERVSFQSWVGSQGIPGASGTIIAEHTLASTYDVPQRGGEQVRINLWLDAGRAPTNGQPLEVIVGRFDFAPSP
jgi:hypothetical protein